jgi:F0F1-type ATP synthase assembly protein I
MHDQGQPEDDDRRSAMSGLGAGYTLLGAVGMGLMIGYAIDRWTQTVPVWTAIMAGVFIIAGLYQVVKEHWPRE